MSLLIAEGTRRSDVVSWGTNISEGERLFQKHSVPGQDITEDREYFVTVHVSVTGEDVFSR